MNKVTYRNLWDMLGGEVLQHSRLPTVKFIGGKKVCSHGYTWGEVEKIPCDVCLNVSRMLSGNKHNLTSTEAGYYEHDAKLLEEQK